jgi:hypothetical protein
MSDGNARSKSVTVAEGENTFGVSTDHYTVKAMGSSSTSMSTQIWVIIQLSSSAHPLSPIDPLPLLAPM